MPTTLARDRAFKWLALDKIVPNERNPRSAPSFTLDELQDLTRSIQRHGILEPLIVQPYEQGMFLLIEGERRWTVAKHLKLKEVPTIVQPNKLDPDEQVAMMYNLHENRRSWEMADHLTALQQLMVNKPDLSEADLAIELGVTLGTLRDRLRVLGMGKAVVNDIARGRIDYTSALRTAHSATAITKARPELAAELGGEAGIQKALIKKAKARGGISHELVTGKRDLTDGAHVSDDLVKDYLTKPESGLRDLRLAAPATATQRATVRTLAKNVMKLEGDLRALVGEDLTQAPNLRALRDALSELVQVAQGLEARVTEAILNKDVVPQTERITLRGQVQRAAAAQDSTVEAALAAADEARNIPREPGE